MFNAEVVVTGIANGVRSALTASQQLLGFEAIDFEQPKIHPEYLVTVEVAKSLSNPDRVVVMETHTDDLRSNARQAALIKARLTHRSRQEVEYQQRVDAIDRIMADPSLEFSNDEQGNGKKRVDIALFRSEPRNSPLLIAEAKLGRQSPKAILKDIDRVIRLLRLYKDLDVDGPLYGAVLFYRMLKGGSPEGVRGRAKNLLTEVNAHLQAEQAKPNQNWLRAKADLLTRGAFHEDVQAYEDLLPDGTIEEIYGRKGFAFAPGLILLGSTSDVDSVTL